VSAPDIIGDLIRREGGYVAHPLDKGGVTNWGITIPTLQAWRERPVDATDIKELREDEARAIYAARYVKPFEDLSDDIRPQVVDIAVNSGTSRARALLAEAQHEAAITKRSVSTELTIARLRFYATIVHDNPSQSAFIRGWVARACEFLK
jgi:lysozyme family protein